MISNKVQDFIFGVSIDFELIELFFEGSDGLFDLVGWLGKWLWYHSNCFNRYQFIIDGQKRFNIIPQCILIWLLSRYQLLTCLNTIQWQSQRIVVMLSSIDNSAWFRIWKYLWLIVILRSNLIPMTVFLAK